jgi:hypothetical protein
MLRYGQFKVLLFMLFPEQCKIQEFLFFFRSIWNKALFWKHSVIPLVL